MFAIQLLLMVGVANGLHSNVLGETKGARVFRVHPKDSTELDDIQKKFSSDVADFWTLPRQIGDSVDFMTLEWMYPVMKNMLTKMEIHFDVINDDVDTLIDEHLKLVKQGNRTGFDWSTYHPYDSIMAWMDEIASEHSSVVSIKKFGESFEERELKVIKISSGGDFKSAVWINGGLYGREWISPAVSTFLINEIVQNKDLQSDLLNSFDLFFVPVANPDGYAYTWSNVRLWRKTRSDKKLKTGCVGVDPNRNWDVEWNVKEKTKNPCSDNYPGSKPFSEREMENLKEVILDEGANVEYLLDLHAYGQKWLSACSYSGNFKEDCKELDNLGERLASASSKSSGTKYEYVSGSPLTYKYSMSGSLVEWARTSAQIQNSYVVELPDSGEFGFFLPPSKIASVGNEIVSALREILKYHKEQTLKTERKSVKETLKEEL